MLTAIGAQAQNPAATPSREPWLVTSAWLQEHLGDPDLVVLQIAATRREYRQGHVPGARFLWSQSYAPSTPDGSYDLPTLEQAAALAAELGLRPDSRIVLVYTGLQVQQTARALLTLEQFGLGRRASILNGGFDVWKAEGRPVSTETPQFAAGTARPTAGGRFVADAAYVQARLNQPAATIVDAREARFYKGEGGGQPRPGHIPGAVNVPYRLVARRQPRQGRGRAAGDLHGGGREARHRDRVRTATSASRRASCGSPRASWGTRRGSTTDRSRTGAGVTISPSSTRRLSRSSRVSVPVPARAGPVLGR